MNVLSYFICIAIGIAVDSFYNHVRRVESCRAYREGLEQGRYEEKIRGEKSYERYTTLQPIPKTNAYTLPALFEKRYRENGHATVQINQQKVVGK